MTKYIITSDLFEGEVALAYSDGGYMISFDFSDCHMGENQQQWLLKNMPQTIKALNDLVKLAPSLKLQEIPNEITFDMFWNKYDDKLNSSKRRCLVKWNKMGESDRMRAYRYINVYFRHLPQGTRKKYAETYLNAEQWNN